MTACSDGVARIWTSNPERLADPLDLESYVSQLSQYKLSRYYLISVISVLFEVAHAFFIAKNISQSGLALVLDLDFMYTNVFCFYFIIMHICYIYCCKHVCTFVVTWNDCLYLLILSAYFIATLLLHFLNSVYCL